MVCCLLLESCPFKLSLYNLLVKIAAIRRRILRRQQTGGLLVRVYTLLSLPRPMMNVLGCNVETDFRYCPPELLSDLLEKKNK